MLLLFLAVALNAQGAAKVIVDGNGSDLSEFLELFPLPPGVRLQGQWDGRDAGLARQFDANGIEAMLVKVDHAGTLREDDDGDAAGKASGAAVQHRGEILARIVAPDDDGIARSHDGAEKGHGYKAFLDDKRKGADGAQYAGEHEGFQRAHVVGHVDAGTLKFRGVAQPFDKDAAPDALKNFGDGDAGMHPCGVVALSPGGAAAEPLQGAEEQAAVEHGGRHAAAQRAERAGGSFVSVESLEFV